MQLWPPQCFGHGQHFYVQNYGDMTVLPSQICLSSSRSTPDCCKFVHHVGELEHELVCKKGWHAPSSQHVKSLQKQAMTWSHCLHCTPFSENTFQHSLSDKNMPGSHFLNCKYPNISIHHKNLSSQEMRFMMWKSYHYIENWKLSMWNWKSVWFPHPT